MNAINRLDFLLSGVLTNDSSSNGITQGTSIQPLPTLTFAKHDYCPSSVLPSAVVTAVPLPPRRDSSSLKQHRRRQQIDQSDKQSPYQPLLNSSTLDDLFSALTLECEQYLAATSSYQPKTYDRIILQPLSKAQTAVESNDEDYENLHTTRSAQSITNASSPLKTSIEVMSPIKRHVVSITISSKISSSPSKICSILPPPCIATTSVVAPIVCHSSEEDPVNISSSSSTNRKHRRRRTRKQIVSSTTTRSSSSSNERKEAIIDKKPVITKRSCSTDPRHHHIKNPYDNHSVSSQKHPTRRPRRRDVSLQHPLPISPRRREPRCSPLSVLLTSTKSTSDFIDNSHQRQQRRSRLESIDHKSMTLLDRLHQQFYRPSPTRNNNTNTNIPTHRIPSYPVY